MLLLASTSDKIVVTLGSAVTCESHASYADYDGTDVTPGRRNLEFATAASFDGVLAPASATYRNVKLFIVSNVHASSSTVVTIEHTDGTTVVQLFKATVLAGEKLAFVEGQGWTHFDADGLPRLAVVPSRLDVKKRIVGSDYVNATTSFTDVTGLTAPVEAGKHYNVIAHLFHIENASTTGAQFGFGGVAMTAMRVHELGGFAGGVGAGTMQANVGDVTAVDTAAIAATSSAGTPQVIMAILSGWFNPSADGTFAIRGKSEIAVAAGLTVKVGSHARIWEADA